MPTLIELVVGAMLSQRGWVTAAWLAVAAQRGQFSHSNILVYFILG